MLLTTLLHRILPSRRSPRRPARARLSVERLESRDVPSTLNVNTDTEGLFHNETTIAVNPTNPLNMIGSANDYQAVVHGNGQIHYTVLAHAHVTFDGGHTWSEYPIPFHAYNFCGDPSVSFDADGTAYLSTFAAVHSQNFLHSSEHRTAGDLVVSRSTDEGRTWSDPVRVTRGAGTAGEKETDNDKPFLTAWGHGNAIVTWTQFHIGPGGNEIDQPIFASVTHNGGNSWTAPAQISGPLLFDHFSVPTVAADGSIYVAFVKFDGGEVAFGPRSFYEVVKVDPATGQALGAPVEVGLMYDGSHDYPRNVFGDLTLEDSQFKTLPFGNITADPTNALHLAVVWSDMRNNPYPGGVLPSLDPYQVHTNSDIIVSQSFDGGVHWSAAAAIPTANDQFQPFGAYDASGRLQIGYYDRSYDPANHKYGYTLASETAPGALNFTVQQVTTALSDPTQGDAFPLVVTVNSNFPSATTFMGDYSGIAVTPTGVAALWTDMRVPAPFPGTTEDAFFALVDLPAPLMAPSPAAEPVAQTLSRQQVQPLVTEAIARWQAAGVDMTALQGIDIRIADLGGATLGLASGHTIWLDDNAASWGWFIDPTPRDDSEFTTPGNQGEQHRMDLLTVLMHEVGHVMGHDHDEGGVMADTLATGIRRMPAGETDWLAALDVVFAADLMFAKKHRPNWDW